METETWQPARVIPVSGINGQDEQERRGTSALLAVLGAVREFGNAITKPIGAPAGALQTYIEVPFDLADGSTVRPDGVLVVQRGKTSWTCLIEVKTGTSFLDRSQIEAYLDVAKINGFDAVLTISNEMSPTVGLHPVEVDRRKLRKVALHHISWSEILGHAIEQRVHRGVSDPDQAWLLGELIRYMEHPRSGVRQFQDMGAAWTATRDSVVSGTLRPNDPGLMELSIRWDQLLRFTALQLDRELGVGTGVVSTRKESQDPSSRLANHVQNLTEQARLMGSIRVPKSVSDLEIAVDLRAGQVLVSSEINAPSEGRPLTRINWLLRQIADCPESIRIDAHSLGARTSMSELLRTARENPTMLINADRPEIRKFRLTTTAKAGLKRGRGTNCFIDSVIDAVDSHYTIVHQRLRPWSPRPPQMPANSDAVAAAGVDVTPEQGATTSFERLT